MKKWTFEKLYKKLFYIPKHEKLSDKVFRCRMTVSLLTIFACTAVMAASTFALFYSEFSTDNSTLVGAYYSVTLDNVDNDTYICPLVFEDKHTFEIKADGTATTGYCKIQVGEDIYYTDLISQGHSLVLTVQAAKDTPIIFTPQWGMSYEATCGNEINHSETPYALYKVEPSATLAGIAAHYGVPEADILTYNGITELNVGNELKIPGVSYDIRPYVAPVPEPPASTEENTGDNTRGENNDPPVVDDTVSGDYVGTGGQLTSGDTTTGEQPTEEQPTVETPTIDETTSHAEQSTTEQPTVETPSTEETTSSGETAEVEEPMEKPVPADDATARG